MLYNKYLKILFKKIEFYIYRFPLPLSSKEVNNLKNGPKVLVNSIPKSGTNLLGHVIGLFPSVVSRWRYHIGHEVKGFREQIDQIKRGQVATAHLKWSKELNKDFSSSGLKLFLMVRDPRDIAVSNAFYIANKKKSHRLHNYFNNLANFDEQLMASIKGIPSEELDGARRSKSIGEHIREFLPWVDNPDFLVIRFEDLIGKAGGGSDKLKQKAVDQIASHIGTEIDQATRKYILNNAFSKQSSTFRKGQIGDWKNHFKDEHKKIFKKSANDTLIKLGYEINQNW